MLTTKEKGDIGSTKIMAEITEKLYNVSIPIAEHLKYDLIIEKNGKMCRVQSKYTLMKDNKIEVKIESLWANKKGNHSSKRQKGDYDILAVYCPNTKECYFLADKDFESKTSVILRVNSAKNKNSKIRWAKDYKDIDQAFNRG